MRKIQIIHTTSGLLGEEEAPAFPDIEPGKQIDYKGTQYVVRVVEGDTRHGPAQIVVGDLNR